MDDYSLEELRERALEMMETAPAETTPEATWLVEELKKNKEVIVGIIDYLLTKET